MLRDSTKLLVRDAANLVVHDRPALRRREEWQDRATCAMCRAMAKLGVFLDQSPLGYTVRSELSATFFAERLADCIFGEPPICHLPIKRGRLCRMLLRKPGSLCPDDVPVVTSI